MDRRIAGLTLGAWLAPWGIHTAAAQLEHGTRRAAGGIELEARRPGMTSAAFAEFERRVSRGDSSR